MKQDIMGSCRASKGIKEIKGTITAVSLTNDAKGSLETPRQADVHSRLPADLSEKMPRTSPKSRPADS